MKKRKTYFALIGILVMVIWQSCNPGPERRNKELIVKAHDELFNKGNLDFADQVFAADYFGGGPDVVKEFVSDMKVAMPDLQYTLSPIVAEGNQVSWMRTITGTLTKPYMGHEPTGKKVSFSTMAVSTFNEDGKVTEERWVSEQDAAISESTGIEGVYTYVPPLQGQSIVRNGRYTFLFGPSNGKGPMVGEAGTYAMSGDTVKNVITWSSDPKRVGQGYGWMVKRWAGDTAVYDIFDGKGKVIDTGKSIRVSK